MDSEPSDPTLEAFSADILTGMRAWQLQHSDATLTEIEHALDERWDRLRARLRADRARQREAATWQSTAPRPTCPDCGRKLIRRGRQPRRLKSHGNHDLTFTRAYGYCPSCKKGHFPPG